MHTMSDISATVLLMGAGQAVFFALLLMSFRRGYRMSNGLLAVLLIVLASGLISISGDPARMRILSAADFHLLPWVMIACVPLHFLYIKSLTVSDFRLSMRNLLHFLPVMLCIPFIIDRSMPVSGLPASPLSSTFDSRSVVRFIPVTYALFYLLMIRRLISCHMHDVVRSYRVHNHICSDILDKLSVHGWINTLYKAGWTFWLLSVGSVFFPAAAGYCTTIAAVAAVLIYILGYSALRKPRVLFQPDPASNTANDQSKKGE